jgi:hypothetical protein
MPQHGRRVTANIDRLNACMDRNGLAAVAVRTGVNFTYLSGMAMPGTLARHLDIASTVRGFMVLVAAERGSGRRSRCFCRKACAPGVLDRTGRNLPGVCTENSIRVCRMTESAKLAR